MALVKVIFKKAFGAKEKGEVGEYDSMLASVLIHQKKVAKPYKEGGGILGLGKKSKPENKQ